MNVDTMRTVDRLIGIPLTFLLTLWIKIIEIVKPSKKTKAKRILFIELSEMGSTILVNPALEKIKTKLSAELYFVIFKKNRASLHLLNTVPQENIFTIREDNLLKLLIDTLRFLLWTRKNKLDTVIDLELFSRFTALLTGASGATQRVGFHSFHNEGLYRGDLLTKKVAYNPHIHIAKNFIALVNSVLTDKQEVPFSKIKISDNEITLPCIESSEDELRNIQKIITDRYPYYNSEYNRVVLINPNASELLPQRRWMPERYEALIERILTLGDEILIVITGAKGEFTEAEAMCKRIGNERCINFAGATTLEGLIPLYNTAELMVTNDSGPGHFSSITPLTTLVLFGPETPALYGSLGNAISIYADLACSPCVSASNHRKTACTDNKCLQAITVDQVFNLVRKKL